MPLFSKPLDNLLGGVSQQAASLRRPNQCAEQVNFNPSLKNGLVPRNPLVHVAKIIDGQVPDAFIHTIDRDKTERYISVLANDDLKVFSLAGTPQTIAFPNGKDYITNPTPSTKFKALTIADYSFMVNTAKTVRMASDLSPWNGAQALVFVRQGAYNASYLIYIDGVLRATYQSDDIESRTDVIAQYLTIQLATGLPSGWFFARFGSVILIHKLDNTPWRLDVSDSLGSDGLIKVKDEVQRFSDLPTIGIDGFIVKVSGNRETGVDDYYVKFRPNEGAAPGTFGNGVWEETVATKIKYKLDPDTLPYSLVRLEDGTFELRRNPWGNRVAGDEVTAPTPSFVNRKLNDIYLYKNRLGFLADENAILSRVGSFFDFFPETVQAILDSDPIDVAVSHSRVSILRHAVPHKGALLCFSENTEFSLAGEQILSPKTVNLTQASEYGCSRQVKPVAAGNSIFFPYETGNYSGLREYFIEPDTNQRNAIDVTDHVPRFVPKNLKKIAVNTDENILVALAADTPNKLYVYHYYWVGQEKLQSAWHTYEFSADTQIRFIEFIEKTLYLAVQRADGLYLEKLSFDSAYQEVDCAFPILLDRRVRLTGGTYNAGDNTTTYNFPYTPTADLTAVCLQCGEKPITLLPGNQIRVPGQQADPLYVGQLYGGRYQFSPYYLREGDGKGSNLVNTGRLQLRHLFLRYEDSAAFRVSVTPSFRATSTYSFNSNLLGSGYSAIGEIKLQSGVFPIPILARNDEVAIVVCFDSWLPCKFTEAEFEGFYTTRSNR